MPQRTWRRWAPRFLLMALPVAAVGAGKAGAELLYFRDGGRAQVPAVIENGRVSSSTPFGRFTFAESEFLNVVPGFNPDVEWDARRAEALRGDEPARLEAAWWALQNGAVEGCVELLRSTKGPGLPGPTSVRLNAILDRLEGELPAPDTSAFEQALGLDLKATKGPRVYLFHQHETDQARRQLQHLDRVVQAFYLWFGFLGVDLDPPRNALVFVQLRERGDYARFLTSQNAGALTNTQGYYHPTYRAVLAYDLPGGAPTPPGDADPPVEGPSARRRLLAESERLAQQVGVASHEMVHLLVAASGLDPDSTRLPLWLHEGIATQFEVVRGGRWAGVGRAHDIRLKDWRQGPPAPSLAKVLRDEGFGRGYDRFLYASCWSLVNYLTAARPGEFVAYLDHLRGPGLGAGTEDRRERGTEGFRRAFGGDLSSIEAGWREHADGLRAPLDSWPADRRGERTPGQ